MTKVRDTSSTYKVKVLTGLILEKTIMKVFKLSLPPGTLERVSQQKIQQVLRYITWKQKCLPHGGATGNIRGWVVLGWSKHLRGGSVMSHNRATPPPG